MHLETHPRHVIVKLDIKNMLNEVTHAAMICVFERHLDLRSMVPFLLVMHSPKLLVFYTSGKHAKPCVEGSHQGTEKQASLPQQQSRSRLSQLTRHLQLHARALHVLTSMTHTCVANLLWSHRHSLTSRQ